MSIGRRLLRQPDPAPRRRRHGGARRARLHRRAAHLHRERPRLLPRHAERASSPPRTTPASWCRSARGAWATCSAARPRAASSPTTPTSARCSRRPPRRRPAAPTSRACASSCTSGSTRRSTPAPTASSATSRIGPTRSTSGSTERWGCRCEVCRGVPRRFGEDMPTELTPEVLAFREGCRWSTSSATSSPTSPRQGASRRSARCPTPRAPHGISDWSRLAALPGLHTLGTDPYWKALRRAGRAVRGRVRAARRRPRPRARPRPQIWIQGFRLPAADAEDIAPRCASRARRASRTCGCGASRPAAHMSTLGGRDPAAVWDALCDALLGGARVITEPRRRPRRPRSARHRRRGARAQRRQRRRARCAARGRGRARRARSMPRRSAPGASIYVGAGSAGEIAAADAAEWARPSPSPEGAVVALVAGASAPPGPLREAAEDDGDARRRRAGRARPDARGRRWGVSASGRTPYTLGALRAAPAAGALTASRRLRPRHAAGRGSA